MTKFIAFLAAMILGTVPISMSYNAGSDVYIMMENLENELYYDDVITLRCYIDGINEPYSIVWQYMDPKDETGEWRTLDCNSDVYEFVLTPENADYSYRVQVVCEDAYYTADNLATRTDIFKHN